MLEFTKEEEIEEALENEIENDLDHFTKTEKLDAITDNDMLVDDLENQKDHLTKDQIEGIKDIVD